MKPMLAAIPATLALVGSTTPAAAADRQCILAVTQCATAEAGWFGAYACANVPAGDPAAACSGHGTSGYVFGLSCYGTGDGPVTVTTSGCGMTLSGVMFVPVSGARWAWSPVASICHTVGVTATFNLVESITAEDELCIGLG